MNYNVKTPTASVNSIMENVRRWRRDHGLQPNATKFRNEPKVITKKPVVIDVVATVKKDEVQP